MPQSRANRCNGKTTLTSKLTLTTVVGVGFFFEAVMEKPNFMPQRFSVTKYGSSDTIKFRHGQLCQSVLATAFDYVPSSVSLVSDDGDMETADAEGCFPSHGMDPRRKWVCKGSPYFRAETSAKHSSHRRKTKRVESSSAMVGSSPHASTTEAAVSTPGVAKRRHTAAQSVYLAVVACSVDVSERGKLIVQPVSAFRLVVEEQHCRLAEVAGKISREAFGGSDVTLLNSQNIAFLETSAASCKYTPCIRDHLAALTPLQEVCVPLK